MPTQNNQNFDTCVSFFIDNGAYQGRLIRMSSVLDTIIGKHCYPRPVAAVVAESTVLAAMLASTLKYEGLFTLQTQSNGAVSMVVVDVTSEGKIRACASFDEEHLKQNQELRKTSGVHGTEAMYANPQLAALLGDAMGVMFQKNGHKTVYIMGDTVWTADVNKALNRFNPDVLVMNTGYARINGIAEGIIMGTPDVLKVTQVMPKAKIITVHMDTVNHTTVSRDDMRKFLKGENITERVAVPEDGEAIKF